ncbi:MAG: SymE family type I addiction module toxin [Sediminibacterium sp.]|nr:SymE family type I addiction module toxin [Sediminibacterium sp.]
MAEQETSPVKVRQMTVCNKYFPRQSSISNQFRGNVTFPIISLSGKWLLDSGFRAGQVVDIAYEDCRLTITIAKEQRFKDV